ncbi:hypothetical protein TRAPUB_2746 [Trametes pubescens]|uniref:Uncharacterized protein n=1 Tax=Trametes pubescens TaxID=154538 RepID=A0A1M2VFQ5_TRAPU|nr:hypothetical protein TRAPUB_2746 [Trametes pubescens]
MPQRSSNKRSRPDEMYDAAALSSLPLKKMRTAEGEVPDLQAAVSGWYMPPCYYPGYYPPGYYVIPLVPGPSNYWPWPQSVGTHDPHYSEVQTAANTLPGATDDQAAGAPLPDAPENAHTQRPRRKNNDIAPTLIPGIRSGICGFSGCQVSLDPKKGENNRKHLKEKHLSNDTLGNNAELTCEWSGCGRQIEGKRMMAHIEKDHIGYAYQCLVPRCRHAWKGSRAKDWTTHMNREHSGWRG